MDTTLIQKQSDTGWTQQLKDAVIAQIKATIKANLDSAFGNCKTEVTDDARQKPNADRTVTIKNQQGWWRANANEDSKPVWGRWDPGSKNTNVYLKNFTQLHPSDFKTDGKWDPVKLGTAIGNVAAHELAHSYSAGHDENPYTPSAPGPQNPAHTPNKMSHVLNGPALAGSLHLNPAANTMLAANANSGPCAATTDFNMLGPIPEHWSCAVTTAEGDIIEPHQLDAMLSFSGPLAGQFELGWWSVDTDNGATDGNPWGDFVLKSPLTGTQLDAPMITFFQRSPAHFVLRGRAGTPYSGQLFPVDPADAILSDPVTRPDGLVVYRIAELSWFVDADPVPDVVVTLNTQTHGPDNPPYNGFRMGTGEPMTVAEAKQLCDGYYVMVNGIATAGYADCWYLESPDRSCGIKLISTPGPPAPGIPMPFRALVRGKRGTAGPESCIYVTEVDHLGPAVIGPLGMPNRSVGGGDFEYFPGEWASGQAGVADGIGINTIGLLVRTCGSVVHVDQHTFMISDGSGRPIKCITPTDVPVDPTIMHMAVTGVCSCYQEGEDILPLIRVRTQADMTGF
ncbi:MAG: hypothetical protein ACPL7K_02125 [Armatimonadota bacterium]